MSLKKSLILIGSITTVLLIILCVLLAGSFEEPVSDVGITRPDVPIEYQEPSKDSQQTEIPQTVEDNLDQKIEGYLSAGKFDELDTLLASYAEHYTDGANHNRSLMMEIDNYRADLTYIKLLQENDAPLTNWSLKNPDVLAAAYCYLPVSAKYLAPFKKSSPVFPSSRSNIQLTERELDKKETYALLQTIFYDSPFEVHTVRLFDVKINDEDVEIVTIIDPETRQWVLYEARVGWEGALTSEEVSEMIEEYGVTNIDEIVLM